MGRKRRGGGLSATQQAGKFLGVSVLAGAVLAGLALPAVGTLGLAAKETIQGFDELPGELTRPPLSQKTSILDADGGAIAEVYSRNRTVVPLDDISPHMQDAIIAIEDARFYEHGAIDLRGVLRALNRNLEEGGAAEGASTLTQQYVKNVFVEAAGDDEEAVAEATRQEVGRKIRELKYAIQLEEELGKDQILENYLNITFFGQQAYGVEAAAQRYFSKGAGDLEVHEAALLAGLVQSPTRFDPLNDEDAATERRNMVIQRMADTQDLSQEEADAAMEQGLGLNLSEPRNGCITAAHDAAFFCDYVMREFLSNPVFGETEAERKARWDLGGMTIQTTLRPEAQAAAAEAAVSEVSPDDSVAASVVQVEPGTGHIMSMAQSRPYGTQNDAHQTMLNLNVSHSMRGSTMGFSPGSTFKPFIAAAALEKGVSPAETYDTDSEIEVEEEDYTTCEGTRYGTGQWSVENESEDASGSWDMTDALGESINTYFALLMQEAGLCETADMVNGLGLRGGDDEELNITPASTLGSNETTPLAMANAYAAFADRGNYCEPISILGVTDADGNELPSPESGCSTAMSQRTADTMNMMLRGVVEEGTGQQAGLPGDVDNAGKTGTSERRTNVWFVGYTPEVSTAVRVGSDGGEMEEMYDISIGGQHYERATGGGLAGPIWQTAMTGALAGVESTPFEEVDVPRGDDDDDDDDDGNSNGDDGDGDSDDDRDRGSDRDRGDDGDDDDGNADDGRPGGGRGDWDWGDLPDRWDRDRDN